MSFECDHTRVNSVVFLFNPTTFFEKAYIDRAKFRFHNYYLHDLLSKGMFWKSAEVARVTCFPPAQVLKTIPALVNYSQTDLSSIF